MMTLLQFSNQGETEPATGYGRYISRNHEAAKRMGFNRFGPGLGLQRFIWANAEFKGMPTKDAPAHTLHPVPTGIEPGQSLKLVGTFVVPTGLEVDLFFVLSMGRDRRVKQPGSWGSIFLNGEHILGTHEDRFLYREIIWQPMKDVQPGAFAWYEIQSELFDLSTYQTMDIEISFAVPEGEGNHYVAKIAKKLSDEYTFAEHLAPDLCLTDHTFVYPTSVQPGEKVLLSWHSSFGDKLLLNGEGIASSGSRQVKVHEDCVFAFKVGEKEYRHQVVVES